jgi:hypothetical protein
LHDLYRAFMTDDDGLALALAEARGNRWLPAERVHALEEAAGFVDDVGIALLFPADRVIAPSLWEAVAGPDAVPFADGMGTAELMVWTWKDTLPEGGLAWSGKYLHQRASLLSPDLLAALYPGRGEPDDHDAFELSPEAHQVADALLPGALPSSALRELIGHRGRYDRAIRQLQGLLLVTSAGVREQRSGWPAVVLDLTCRRFDVGAARSGPDHAYATGRYLATMIESAVADLARTFGWTAADARARLDALVESGRATRVGNRYRAVDSKLPVT